MPSNIPKRDSLVVCRVKTINPHSAVVELVEYNRMGMIHVSEVASRWVKNIREFLKENQFIVCRVMDADENSVSLSLKRVFREDQTRKLNEYKREKRNEKLLEMVAKKLGKSLEQAKMEVGDLLINEFGSYSKTFDIAFRNPELLEKKGVPAKWREALIEVAKKNYEEKVYRVKGSLTLVSHSPEGVDIIKAVLKKAKEQGFEISYIAAPKYMIAVSGKNYKEAEAKVRQIGEAIVKDFESRKGEAKFELEK